MPRIDRAKTPEKLQPYIFHGVDLQWREGEKEATAQCPWCGRENKFTVNIETGQNRCLVCAEGTDKGGGNIYTFIRKLWELSYDATKGDEYKELAAERKLLYDDTLFMWQLAKSTLTDKWLIPGYNAKRQMVRLYPYQKVGGRKVLMAANTMSHMMFGLNLFDPEKPNVAICEGVWDAMAYWETAARTKLVDGTHKETANITSSLLGDTNVVGTPGAGVFMETWLPLFNGKDVVNILTQNDHPRKHPKTGKTITAASYTGAKRIAQMLCTLKEPPKVINILKWGEKGYDPTLPSGYDTRDYLAGAKQ